MSREHVGIEEIGKLRGRELTPQEILEVSRHLATCAECAALAAQQAPIDRCARLLAGLAEHPDVESDLTGYVDGTLSPSRRAEIAGHLESCRQCREDVADLENERERLAPNRQWPRVLFGAIAASAAFVVILLLPRRGPEPQRPILRAPSVKVIRPVGYGRPDWDEAVRDAERSGRIEAPPTLAALRPRADVLRGTAGEAAAHLEPAGVIVESTQPHFTWPAFDDAHYKVGVFNGEKEVTTSGKIDTTSWSPAAPLQRGVLYTWQVEVRRHGNVSILPAPPQPQALFRILDDASAATLADARQRFPNDHLLLGVLAARFGLRASAEEELRQVHTPQAERILESIRRWY